MLKILTITFCGISVFALMLFGYSIDVAIKISVSPTTEKITSEANDMEDMSIFTLTPETQASESTEESVGGATLLYQGVASLRITTREGKNIYIDPYAGDGYDAPADLILVTHQHYDHNNVELIKTRNQNCFEITEKEALVDGTYKIFEFGYVTVEAAEAGYNLYHDVRECVGYILTFSDGKSIYISGDTAQTPQMKLLSDRNLDYSFFCCDGIYTMTMEEAIEAAGWVQAKHSIPYHVIIGQTYSREVAERFNVSGQLIVENGKEITIE